MPIKLIPPRKGFSPYFYMRGTYLGIFVNESTRATRASVAKRAIQERERQIESGRFSRKIVTFTDAAVSYLDAGGDRRPIAKLIAHFGKTPIEQIGQAEIDAAAAVLFPDRSAATRNREVYTPVVAVLRRAGMKPEIKRPDASRGREINEWLWPEDAAKLLNAADEIDKEFGLLCLFLLSTGLRLSEATTHLTCDRLRLSEGSAFIPTTKNGEPRTVFLPPTLVAALANHPRGLERGRERVFRWRKSGRLYNMLDAAAAKAGIVMPERAAFHLFRHTYGTWMRRYAGLDVKGLVDTGAWKSAQSAARYAHAVPTEDAQRAALLPLPQIKAS